MKIIIAGGGEVGFHLAKLLSFESLDITLIDTDKECLHYAESHLDIRTLHGDAMSLSLMKEAKVADSDLFIAVTAEESVNITRLHPFPQDKSKLLQRFASFLAFSFLAAIVSSAKRGPFDAVIALSPPLTLGNVGKIAAIRHRCKLILNLQDIFLEKLYHHFLE